MVGGEEDYKPFASSLINHRPLRLDILHPYAFIGHVIIDLVKGDIRTIRCQRCFFSRRAFLNFACGISDAWGALFPIRGSSRLTLNNSYWSN